MRNILFQVFLFLLGVFATVAALLLTGERAKRIATAIIGMLCIAVGVFWAGYEFGANERLSASPDLKAGSLVPAPTTGLSTTPLAISPTQTNPAGDMGQVVTSTAQATAAQSTPLQVFLQDVPVDNGHTPERGLAIISGQSFPHSLRYVFVGCCDEFTTDYNLGGRFTHFHSSIGLEDNTNYKAQVEVYLDDVRIFVKSLDSAMKPLPIDLDISNGGRLHLVVTATCPGFACQGAADWGDAVVTNP